MARLRGQVEIAEALERQAPSPPFARKIEATVKAMRDAGAPENAEKMAAEGGIEIEFIRKRNFRKEDR